MSAHEKLDVLLSGVGGQGIILASDILCEVALETGYDVKKSDSLGMSQRGGSVVSHVRLAEEVRSPLIRQGDVDILLAFEKLEAARWAPFLKRGGVAIANDHAIPTLMVSVGEQEYPADDSLRDILLERASRVFFVPGQANTLELGDPRVLNLVMLGFVSTFLPMDVERWLEVIPRKVPSRFVDLNLRAFQQGRAQLKGEGG